jgi:ADP-heptose:LPS heptosyltransferase
MSFQPSTVRSILIIQLEPFGDVLLNTSYLMVLKNHFPQAKIDFLVSQPYDSVLYKHPAISELITFRKLKGLSYTLERLRIFKVVRQRKYDLVIDQQCGTGSGQIVLFSSAKYRLGFIDSKWNWCYNLKAERGPKRYSASQKFDILHPLGIVEVPYELYYYIKDESITYIHDWLKEEQLMDKEIICFSPGSPDPRKIWSIQNYAQLADLILENSDYQIVILWAKNEKEDVVKMMNLMKMKAILAPKTNLNQAASLLKNCSLLICNDGGINHISVSTHTPSLAFYGPTDAQNWSPSSVFPNHASLGNLAKYKAGDNSFGITVEEAYYKVKELLESLKAK